MPIFFCAFDFEDFSDFFLGFFMFGLLVLLLLIVTSPDISWLFDSIPPNTSILSLADGFRLANTFYISIFLITYFLSFEVYYFYKSNVSAPPLFVLLTEPLLIELTDYYSYNDKRSVFVFSSGGLLNLALGKWNGPCLSMIGAIGSGGMLHASVGKISLPT